MDKKVIGLYRIQDVLEQGGMGIVHLGQHEQTVMSSNKL